MSDSKTASQQETHKPSADAASQLHAVFGSVQREALRVADESEKMVERSMQEIKRAQHDGARLWESQLELQQSMTRAMFDSVRRLWNV